MLNKRCDIRFEKIMEIPKYVMLSSIKSPIKTQEIIFEVDILARVNQESKISQKLRTSHAVSVLHKSTQFWPVPSVDDQVLGRRLQNWSRRDRKGHESAPNFSLKNRKFKNWTENELEASNSFSLTQIILKTLFSRENRFILTPERTKFFTPGTHMLGPDTAFCLGL